MTTNHESLGNAPVEDSPNEWAGAMADLPSVPSAAEAYMGSVASAEVPKGETNDYMGNITSEEALEDEANNYTGGITNKEVLNDDVNVYMGSLAEDSLPEPSLDDSPERPDDSSASLEMVQESSSEEMEM